MNIQLDQLLVMLVKAFGGELELTIADLESLSPNDTVEATWTEKGLLLKYKNHSVIEGVWD